MALWLKILLTVVVWLFHREYQFRAHTRAYQARRHQKERQRQSRDDELSSARSER